MPWNEESVMSQKERLIEAMLLETTNVTELCERLDISRKTAYKWLKRYNKNGLDGLVEQKRTPSYQPNKVSSQLEQVVIETHKEFPYWGPHKLKGYLINEHRLNEVPSHQTISKILKRNNCEVIKNHRQNSATKRFQRDTPNDLWQMDFKGHYKMAMQRCHPLTILDDHSRFSIGIKACTDEQGVTVQSHLIDVFREYGMPNQINVDNGSPWGQADLESNTSLKIWLIKLGIHLTHSAPYHPQTNGKDERFHRTLKLEVLHERQYKNILDMQRAFDKWRHIYNYKRPHHSLNNQTPHMRYHPSSKQFPNKLLEPEYDKNDEVRRVTNSGLIRFEGKIIRVGKALRKEYVAIRETAVSDEFAVFFMDSFIKKISLQNTAY